MKSQDNLTVVINRGWVLAVFQQRYSESFCAFLGYSEEHVESFISSSTGGDQDWELIEKTIYKGSPHNYGDTPIEAINNLTTFINLIPEEHLIDYLDAVSNFQISTLTEIPDKLLSFKQNRFNLQEILTKFHGKNYDHRWVNSPLVG